MTQGRRMEIITIDDEILGRFLKVARKRKLPGDSVLRMKDADFMGVFARVLDVVLRLERMKYMPYSIRREGATADSRQHGSMDGEDGREAVQRGSTSWEGWRLS